MPRTEQNFEMYAGETKNIVGQVLDEDEQPIDLTDAMLSWVVKRRAHYSAVVLRKSTLPGSGIALLVPASGTYLMQLDAEDTEALYGVYYHETTLTDADGNPSTTTIGTLTVHRSSR